MAQSLFELAGGEAGVSRLALRFYDRVLADPLLLPLFRDPEKDHAGHMALFLAELLGGPREHSRRGGGFARMVNAHRELQISDAQRNRWVERMLSTCAEPGLPPVLMEVFEPFIQTGARLPQLDGKR